MPEVVYVLNKDGHPLMPTERHGKVRRMLRNGEAKVGTIGDLMALIEKGN